MICNCHADHILPLFRTDRATNMVLSGSVMLCSTLNSPRHIGRMWSSSFWQVLPFGKSQIVLGSRSEEHTSELQSLMRISYAVFCLKKKKTHTKIKTTLTNK